MSPPPNSLWTALLPGTDSHSRPLDLNDLAFFPPHSYKTSSGILPSSEPLLEQMCCSAERAQASLKWVQNISLAVVGLYLQKTVAEWELVWVVTGFRSAGGTITISNMGGDLEWGTAWPQASRCCWECVEEGGSSRNLPRAYGNICISSFPVLCWFGFFSLSWVLGECYLHSQRAHWKSQHPLSLDSKAFIIFRQVRELSVLHRHFSVPFLPLLQSVSCLINQMRWSEG